MEIEPTATEPAPTHTPYVIAVCGELKGEAIQFLEARSVW